MSADPITWQTTHGDTVEVYRADRVGHYGCPDSCPDIFFRYRVRATNNKVVEQSSEAYTRRSAAVKAALRHHPRVETLADLPAGGYPEMTGGLSTSAYLDEIRGEVQP